MSLRKPRCIIFARGQKAVWLVPDSKRLGQRTCDKDVDEVGAGVEEEKSGHSFYTVEERFQKSSTALHHAGGFLQATSSRNKGISVFPLEDLGGHKFIFQIPRFLSTAFCSCLDPRKTYFISICRAQSQEYVLTPELCLTSGFWKYIRIFSTSKLLQQESVLCVHWCVRVCAWWVLCVLCPKFYSEA